MLGVLIMAAFGWQSMSSIPLDAVPDITNNQVQVVTQSPSLSAEEVEQFITYPLELNLTNLPGVVEVRSISKFGLSIVTIIFEEDIPDLSARQLVAEQLTMVKGDIPEALGTPEMMPITTGLGEIYQYVLRVRPDAPHEYSTTELRTMHDWVLKRQLSGIPGIIEISSFGGFIKQYEVQPLPEQMAHFNLSVEELGQAIAANNHSAGGSYYTSNNQSFYARAMGRISDPAELAQIPVKTDGQGVVRLGDVAKVGEGHAVRFGAMTMDGKGEVVGGITLMLKGENAHATVRSVRERVEQIQSSLPEGVSIEPYLDRSALVDRTTATVAKNLIEGGVIVILVLVLLLGNLRAGLVVASTIPLAMLFALILMNQFGVSANLMSLGAIDFGIVVDGAVIVAEHLLAVLSIGYLGKKLAKEDFQEIIIRSSSEMIKSAFFGVLIILVVFVPIITLVGIEGKMFRPMALTVSFALLGALLLSLTYIPAMLSIVLKPTGVEEPKFSKAIVSFLKKVYTPTLSWSMHRANVVFIFAAALFVLSLVGFGSLGSEFIPKLDEGDVAAQMQLPAGTSLEESVATSTAAEKVLLSFPQVKHVVSKIGTAEVPTDPMSIEQADMMVILHDPEFWPEPIEKEVLVGQMADALAAQVPYGEFEFTQPIELRFNELISGAKSDVAVKLFGPDFEVLSAFADQMVPVLEGVEGAVDVKREMTDGLNQRHVVYDRAKLSALGVSVEQANHNVQAAFAGVAVSTIYESDRRFEVVVRMPESFRSQPQLNTIFVKAASGNLVPLSAFASLEYHDGPSQISRENGQRRVVVGCNVRGRDIESVVIDIQNALAEVDLPAGYYFEYGGDFEQLQEAKHRLSIAVPVALGAIFILLFLSFASLRLATMVFISVPLSAIGGVGALWLRDMPFSISAGIGFIALFGVAVLNGIVMISHLSEKATTHSTKEIMFLAGQRLRPVMMTAMVAALGFLPMALSSGAGAEVQKPLATVVIGGLVTATLLTLVVLPVVYDRFGKHKHMKHTAAVVLLMGLFMIPQASKAQEVKTLSEALSAVGNSAIATQQSALRMEKMAAENRLDWATNVAMNVQQGQINTAVDQDYFFTLEVQLPSLMSAPALMKLHKSRMQWAAAEWAYTQHYQRYTVKSLWNAMERSASMLALLEAHYELAQSMEEKVRSRSALGLIPGREAVRWHVMVEELHHRIKEENLILDQNKTAIASLLGWELWSPAVGAEIPAILLPANASDALVLQPSYAVVQNAAGAVKVQQGTWMPQFGIGAFTQKLEGNPGLNGVQFSTAIPLSPGVYSKRVKVKQLEYEDAALALEAARREWGAIVAQLQGELQRWAPEDHHDLSFVGTEPGVLWELYSAGELDLEGLWQALEASYAQEILELEHHHKYIDVVNQWNFYQKTTQGE